MLPPPGAESRTSTHPRSREQNQGRYQYDYRSFSIEMSHSHKGSVLLATDSVLLFFPTMVLFLINLSAAVLSRLALTPVGGATLANTIISWR